jgi:hypothetical protein
MAVSCSNCGERWPRDPALEVKRPTCHAPAGVRCKRPSGHGCDIHASRDQAAMDAGFLRMCPKGPSATTAEALQGSLF